MNTQDAPGHSCVVLLLSAVDLFSFCIPYIGYARFHIRVGTLCRMHIGNQHTEECKNTPLHSATAAPTVSNIRPIRAKANKQKTDLRVGKHSLTLSMNKISVIKFCIIDICTCIMLSNLSLNNMHAFVPQMA